MAVELFSELPYASALESECLKTYCSNCFLPAATMCTRGCNNVVYCSEMCADVDWPLHTMECAAFSGLAPFHIQRLGTSSLRVLGRYIARQRIDGGKASLSTNFPTYVEARKCSDLMTHYKDMKKDKNHRDRLANIVCVFGHFFARTALSSADERTIKRAFCIMCINTFSIVENNSRVLGCGLYLNASRFNHSCLSSAFVRFEGARMTVNKSSRCAGVKHDTAKAFNSLTVNYGCNELENVFGTLISQRVASLRRRYFFRCRCEMCKDEKAMKLEMDAANAECSRCSKPYVWSECKKLKPTCKCKTQATIIVDAQTAETARTVCMWFGNVLRAPTDSDSVEESEAFWKRAKLIWHPKSNMRLAQIGERLFRGYCEILGADYVDMNPEQRLELLKKSVEIGGMTCEIYSAKQSLGCVTSELCLQLARLHESLQKETGVDHFKEAYDYYTLSSTFATQTDGLHEAQYVMRERNKLVQQRQQCGESSVYK